MKITSCLIFLLMLSSLRITVKAQIPTYNPVRAYYNGRDGYPTWTEHLQWHRIIDMVGYTNGNNDFEKFENARDELYNQGGGVLYYSAGTYNFSDIPGIGPTGRGLMLKTGVIIRGEKPLADSVGKDGTLGLQTHFIFPTQAINGNQVPTDWSFVGILPSGTEELKDVNNVGLAWIHFKNATVYFGPQMDWGITWGTAGSWSSALVKPAWQSRIPDGTFPIDPFAGGGHIFKGAGKGRLVFGCLFEDAAVTNNALDYGSGSSSYYMYKFGPRIGVYGSEVFVANNALPKSTGNFRYQQLTCETNQQAGCPVSCLSTRTSDIIYDYGKTCGIDVNKELLGLANNDAGYYLNGVVVQDNFVYNHGHKGFNLSGQWVIIRNNRNERDYLDGGADIYGLGTGWRLTLDGYTESTPGGPGCISDNLSRAFDLGGKSLWIDSNAFLNTGSDPGNDGEGILCQAHGGTNLYSWAITRNVHLPGGGGLGLMGGYGVDEQGSLIAWNKSWGPVGHEYVGQIRDAAYVDNQASVSLGGTQTDLITSCPTRINVAPIQVQTTTWPDSHFVAVTFTDQSSEEIAFRIDRKRTSDAGWTAIAYRPRH